ncbi:MAG TPA: DEAD/DEAH box helicase [Bacteroidales bacterium]|nr:DEAD/DEAH box helicase [Bacteroidales bacterium]
MVKYGKTYWGQQFLNALLHIDYSNRLPRGRSYASNGKVKNIDFNGSIIQAKVQGSRPKPYDVRVSVPEFTPQQKNELLEAIQQHPSILAAMLNRKLPDELLTLATSLGIKMFPSKWDDFDMKCSCPDWAVPCKHLAAVIYLIANRIDLNPFIVLELHGLDVVAELAKNGIKIDDEFIEKIESWDDYFSKNKPNTKQHPNKVIFDELDFSSIPKHDGALLQILSPSTPFRDKDFKSELLSGFSYAVKQSGKHKFVDYGIKNIYEATDVTLIADHDSGFSVEVEFESYSELYPLVGLFHFFSSEEEVRWWQLAAPLQLWYHYFLFARKLLAQAAVIPMLTTFREINEIFWVPVMHEKGVNIPLELLDKFSGTFSFIKENGENPEYFVGNNQASFILTSLFITEIIRDIFYQNRRIDATDYISQLFFLGTNSKGQAIDPEVINAIQLWLNKIHISKKEYIPVLEIQEHYPLFSIFLHIRKNSKDRLEAPVPVSKFRKQKIFFSIIKDLQHLQAHFPEFNSIINSSGEQSLQFDAEKFAGFLFRIAPVLKLLGVEMLLPKNLKHIIRPAVSLKASVSGKKELNSYLDLISILSFEWQIAIGEELVSEKEFLKLLKDTDGLVKLKDKFIYVTKEDLEKLIRHLHNQNTISRNEMLQVLFSNEYEGTGIKISEELSEIINEFKSVKNIPLPQTLLAQMRPYQLRGYEWLYKNSRLGMGSILADDMGLGKTMQVLAILLKLKEERILEKDKALIVVPTTLLSNWSKEIEKFAPSLSYHIYHGSKRNLDDFEKQDLLLTSYGTFRSDSTELSRRAWHLLVIDEAQNIKNHQAEQTKAIKTTHAKIKIALSGTPVENRLSEYWSIFDFTNKGYLGTIKQFTEQFAKPIAVDKNHNKLDVFKRITAPFIMRRLKTDKSIISDLPEKVENNMYVTLSVKQAALYESTVKAVMKSIENSEGIERKGLVLKMLTALKQIGNHPYQYLKSGPDSPELSGKAMMLLELLHNIIDNNEKTLIFTQYKEMGDLLQSLIRKEFRTEPLFLHGSLNRKQREQVITDFQEKQHKKIFILSLKAGGTGLNLTQAQNVIHYDLWWNPAVETQATDRAYRIGQKKNVMVYRLINKGTMEERIDDMLKSKKNLADMAVSTGEKWLGDLSNTELKELVMLSKDV